MTAPVLEHDWYPVSVPSNVEVGPGSWLYSAFAFLHYRSRRPVGLRVGRQTGIYIDTMFDLGPDGEVEIGDYCTLAGPIFSVRGRVVIGDRVLMSSRVLVADGPFSLPPGDGAPTLAPDQSCPVSVEIGDDAWIGTGAILLAGARIGAGAIVGAAAVVDFDVPELAVVAGSPPRVIGRSG